MVVLVEVVVVVLGILVVVMGIVGLSVVERFVGIKIVERVAEEEMLESEVVRTAVEAYWTSSCNNKNFNLTRETKKRSLTSKTSWWWVGTPMQGFTFYSS